jgi:prepilin-type processing-associated H-X9-DG protein
VVIAIIAILAALLLPEEQATHNRDECADPTRPVVNDGRFAAPGDRLTLRHNKKAVVAMADGHVLPVPFGYATNQIY